MEDTTYIHYEHTDRKLPCNDREVLGSDLLTPVTDRVTCRACVIAVVHQAMVLLNSLARGA